MQHLQAFQPRTIQALPFGRDQGWILKRYAVLSEGHRFDAEVADAATAEAFRRLPPAGKIEDEENNNGVGFQIIHFAQIAVVSPIFYWQWGSVLAHVTQLRAQWDNPTEFADGIEEIFGCVWEMDIVGYEVNAWKTTMLSGAENHADSLACYLELQAP